MSWELILLPEALKQIAHLENAPSKKKILKAVRKTLGLMEINLRHQSLQTHEFTSLKGVNGEKVFEAYAQQHTPCAFRIFWYYGPKKGQITVITITSHPK